MCYTVRGMELVRLTATSWPDGKELLDVLVHPVGEILDLNSRYSGVSPEDIVNAVTHILLLLLRRRRAIGSAQPKRRLPIVASPLQRVSSFSHLSSVPS